MHPPQTYLGSHAGCSAIVARLHNADSGVHATTPFCALAIHIHMLVESVGLPVGRVFSGVLQCGGGQVAAQLA